MFDDDDGYIEQEAGPGDLASMIIDGDDKQYDAGRLVGMCVCKKVISVDLAIQPKTGLPRPVSAFSCCYRFILHTFLFSRPS